MNSPPNIFARGTRPFIEAAERLVMAFSPGAWSPAVRRAVAQRLWLEAMVAIPRFLLLSALLSLAIVHIVLITTQSYGLSQFALSAVMRLLVVELLPLLAAIYVALMPARKIDDISPVPFVASRCFLVIALTAISSVIALGISYLSMYGLTRWGLSNFTHTVGQVFDPIALASLALKTLLFSFAVATLNGTVLVFGVLIGIETLLLLIEFL